MQLPLVADATQQRFERSGTLERVCQFHVGVGNMYLTLQVTLIVFSRVCCIVRVVHTSDTVSITMAGKDDG